MTTIKVKIKLEIEEEIEIDVESDLMHESIEQYMNGVASNLENHVFVEDYVEWELVG